MAGEEVVLDPKELVERKDGFGLCCEVQPFVSQNGIDEDAGDVRKEGVAVNKFNCMIIVMMLMSHYFG